MRPIVFFCVDDEREAFGLPAVSAGFEARRDRCNCTDAFFDWPVLGRFRNLWERGRVEAGFDHSSTAEEPVSVMVSAM